MHRKVLVGRTKKVIFVQIVYGDIIAKLQKDGEKSFAMCMLCLWCGRRRWCWFRLNVFNDASHGCLLTGEKRERSLCSVSRNTFLKKRRVSWCSGGGCVHMGGRGVTVWRWCLTKRRQQPVTWLPCKWLEKGVTVESQRVRQKLCQVHSGSSCYCPASSASWH